MQSQSCEDDPDPNTPSYLSNRIVHSKERLGRYEVLDVFEVLLKVFSVTDLDVPGLAEQVVQLSDLAEHVLKRSRCQ